MSASERLHPDDLDALADRVAERLARFLPALIDAAQRVHVTVDVATIARELGMSETWVYRHAEDLGVERRGSGPKARLRFDLERARAAFATQREPRWAPPARPTRRRARSEAELLPVKDRAA